MNERISANAKKVLSVLADRRCHLTAEEILESIEGVGTATVYRALDHLTELGLIRRLALGKKSAVYEFIRDSHVHFVCRHCGEVYDVPANLTGMVREAVKCCGHEIDYAEITAHGTCSACSGRESMLTMSN